MIMKLFRIVLVCAFFLTAPAIACADLDFRTGPPDGIQTTTSTLADVLALNARAEGKRLDSFASRIEEWTAKSQGYDSTSKTMWLGKDYKTLHSFGPFTRQDGRIGGVRWEQNINGLVVIMGGVHPEDDDFERAMQAARAGSPGDSVKLLGEVTAPVIAYVIEVRPAGDPPTWLFIEKSSGQEVREESVYGAVRTTSTFSEFKTFSGAVVATKIATSNGEPAYDSTATLTSMRLNVPVPAADLNLPASRRDLVQFPAGATSVKIPVTMPFSENERIISDRDYAVPSGTGKSHIVVRVVINGRGLDLALDSGASGILLDKDVATQLGLARYGASGQTVEGEAGGTRVLIPEMHIGELIMKNVAAYEGRFEMRTADTEQVVGLLGFDFIASVGLKVDWDKHEVTAYPQGTMQMPDGGVTIPLRLDDYVPDISVSVGDASSDRFVLDTGSGAMIIPILRGGGFVDVAAGGVLIFPGFSAAHPNETRDQGLGHTTQLLIPEVYLGVVGGVAKGYPVQLKRVVFGAPFEQFLAVVIDPSSRWGGQDLDGLIGYGFLHYFNLYFDYPNSRIVLEPNDQFRNAKHVPPH
jgi:hypothetical protein